MPCSKSNKNRPQSRFLGIKQRMNEHFDAKKLNQTGVLISYVQVTPRTNYLHSTKAGILQAPHLKKQKFLTKKEGEEGGKINK